MINFKVKFPLIKVSNVTIHLFTSLRLFFFGAKCYNASYYYKELSSLEKKDPQQLFQSDRSSARKPRAYHIRNVDFPANFVTSHMV